MEANVIKCPNCGASSTNHTNCEYCGSLLVRFVDKGIDLSTTSYLTNDKVYVGLVDALKKNLERQELSDSAVETGIFYKKSSTVKLSRKRHCVATIFRSGSTTWSDGDPITLGDKNRGLVIKFSFDKHADGNDDSDERIERQHQEFKDLGSFPLFTPHSGIYMRSGSSNRFRSQEYAIDFGQDVEGAARLISEVLSKVYGIPEDAQLVYLGEKEEVPIEKQETENEYSDEEYKKEVLEGDEKLICGGLAGVAFLILVVGLYFGDTLLILLNVLSFPILLLLYMGKIGRKFFYPIVICYGILSFVIIKVLPESKSVDNVVIEQKENTPQQTEEERIKELGYKDGVEFGRSDKGDHLREFVQMGSTMDAALRNIKSVIAPVAYKEEYGDNISKNLLDLYSEQFLEGYKSVVIKK